MPAKDLNNPLHAKESRPARRLPSIAPALTSAAILLAVLIAVWVAVVDDPEGGRSVAVATIEEAEPDATGSLSGDASESTDNAAGPAPAGDQLAVVMPPEFQVGESALPQLIETSSFGPLPRISPDGTRPRDAYARRGRQAGDAPRIAIIVGGLGLSQTGTQNAIEALPEDVTLAFAPYGASLQRWVEKARGEGHEILLQIPLEPMAYPNENPGEHTLLVSADNVANRQNLHWILSRMTSYAGVMNYMGGRFTSEERALVPFLGELGERGLYYVDDGASPRNLVPAVGEALRVPVVTADLILDTDRQPAAIEQQLRALEAIAAEKGVAIGVASAFPNSVRSIARWIADVKSRGVVIVPASATLTP